MGERMVVKGLVLRQHNSKESDIILTVLTAELGKLTVVATGARGRRSKVGAVAQLFSYAEMVLTERNGWHYLSEGSIITLFDGIRRDVVLLSLASYFAELTEFVTGDKEESALLLSHLLNGLYALDTLHRPPELVRAAFTLRLLAEVGFAPLFDACANCGETTPEEPVFDTVGGTLACRSCAEPSGTVPLTHGVLAAIRYILYGNPRRLYSFTLGAKDLALLSHALERYARTVLERDFSSLDFYKRTLVVPYP